MDTAHTLYEKFVESDNPKIITESALEIQKYFSNVSKMEPLNEIGEELLYLIGGKKETLEWYFLLLIIYINTKGYENYFMALKNKKISISNMQFEWANQILIEIRPKMNDDYIKYHTDLMTVLVKANVPRFVDNGDGTITDTESNLMWQKEDDGLKRTFTESKAYCESLVLGGHQDWRQPTIDELRTVSKEWQQIFSNKNDDEPYWSSSIHRNPSYIPEPNEKAKYIALVMFSNGSENNYFLFYKYYTRAVRFRKKENYIEDFKKEVKHKKSIVIEEEEKDIILEEESKKMEVSFWDIIVIWFHNKMELSEMGFLKKLFGKRKDDFNGAKSDAQYAYNDAIQKLKQSGIYDTISSISNSKKKDHKEEQDIWIVEWSETVLSKEDMLKLRESLKEAPILSNTTILDKRKQVKDFIEGNLDEVLNRLKDYMQEDSKRPEFIAFRANWVDGEYINVPTWLRRPDGTQTFWPLLILRKSENVFCLLA